MSNLTPNGRPSRISVPRRAHPICKLIFVEMARQGVTYLEMENRSGILVTTQKAWRGTEFGSRPKVPSLASVEAALGALGWQISPHPSLETLPPEVLAKVEEIGEHFVSDNSVLAAAIAAAISKPGNRSTDGQPAPRLVYREPYWENAA